MKKITINSRKYGIKDVLVDNEDYETVKCLTWHIIKGRMSFYAFANVKNKKDKYTVISMHRFIMGVKNKNIHIDHVDFDGLNNQKNNLRECTRSQNSMNGKSFGKSKYLGVSPTIMKRGNKTYKYWKATAGINRKQFYLGIFKFDDNGEILAAKKYDEYAKTNFGEFANLNFK